MAGGNLDARSSNFSNEKDDDKSLEPDFVDARVEPEGINPIINSSKLIKVRSSTFI